MAATPYSCVLQPGHQAPRRAGFTLVEILIVLVVLGMLAALALPMLAHARETGHRAVCATNLMQVGLAMQQYADDNGRFLPDSSLPHSDPNCSWVDRVYPYAKSTSVFECPAHPEGEYRPGCPPSDTAPIADDTLQGQINYDGSYMLNMMSLTAHRIRRSQIVFPENTILVVDGKANWKTPFYGNNWTAPGYELEPLTVQLLLDIGLADRHSGGVNCLFADGHVKWLTLTSLTRFGQWRLDGRDNPPLPARSTPP